MLARLADDVSYEQIAYHVDVMRVLEERRRTAGTAKSLTSDLVRGVLETSQ